MDRLNKLGGYSLLDVREGECVEVIGFNAGPNARLRLENMGIGVGVRLKVVKIGPVLGPVLIENLHDGNKFALGRRLAEKVVVRLCEKEA